eukprot:scaffold2128_cov96-Isochrysis_galbana.AAC.2
MTLRRPTRSAAWPATTPLAPGAAEATRRSHGTCRRRLKCRCTLNLTATTSPTSAAAETAGASRRGGASRGRNGRDDGTRPAVSIWGSGHLF